MKQLTYRFNLIEIVLAVAVVGFGVVVILGMLPKGLRATQNANIEAYSSEVIDQMGSYLQQTGTDGVLAGAITEHDEKTLLNNFDEGQLGVIADEYIRKYYSVLVWYLNSWQSFDNSGKLEFFQRTNMPGVFKIRQDKDLDTEFGKITEHDMPMMGDLYVIVMGNTLVDEDGEAEDTQIKIDFSGLLRVWKRPMEYQCVKIHDIEESNCENKYDVALVKPNTISGKYATICMELSYPLSLPYKERTKRYYSFDVEKQD